MSILEREGADRFDIQQGAIMECIGKHFSHELKSAPAASCISYSITERMAFPIILLITSPTPMALGHLSKAISLEYDSVTHG